METNKEPDRYYFTTTQLQKVIVHLLYCTFIVCYYEIVADRCRTSCRAPLSLHQHKMLEGKAQS